MTWEEHEKEYCRTLVEKPTPDLIYGVCESWCDANNQIDHFESFEENVGLLFAAKFQNGYYIIRGEETDYVFI